jgi:hypothetical protein
MSEGGQIRSRDWHDAGSAATAGHDPNTLDLILTKMFFSAKVEVGGPLAEYGTGAGTGIGDSVEG